MKNKILFLFLTFLNIKNLSGQDTIIIGKAMNAKAGAVVITGNKHIYYLEGIDYWDKSICGKKISVNGTLEQVKYSEKDSKSEEQVQEIQGDYMLIRNPKWNKLTNRIQRRKPGSIYPPSK
jgi:hypothetical protein